MEVCTYTYQLPHLILYSIKVDLESPPSHGYNYIIDSISHVDVRNRVVVCPFECLIPGREGVGTEFLRMDPSGRFVEGAKCVRHAKWD